MHEHLLMEHPRLPRDHLLDDPNLAAGELALFTAFGAGGPRERTLVELTSHGLRGSTHAEKLQQIARRTGIHIVMGTSFHKKEWHPHEIARWSQQELEDRIASDILEGLGPTKVKAGIIGEVGISDAGPDVTSMEREELKVLKASAAAQRRTRAAMSLHSDNDWRRPSRNGSWRIKVLEYLREEAGVDLNRVIVSHFSPLDVDLVLHRRIIALGAYVSFDSWGSDIGHAAIPEGDYQTYATAIRRLIEEEQCLKKVLLSQDVCTPRHLYVNGGCGYAHLVRDVVPRLKATGVTDDQIRQMMVGNPMTVLPFIESH